MVKINPEFDEPIRERIASTLVAIIDRIEESPSKHSDEIIKKYIQNYYEKRKQIKHSFSNDLLDFLKRDVILKTIDVNKEYFESSSQNVMDELIAFLINLFINEFSEYRDNIEVSNDKYIRKGFSNLISSLNQLKSSPTSMMKLEKWLIEQLKDDWSLIKAIWNDFKDEKINTIEFLKFVIEILDEVFFYDIVYSFLKK
jgi:hypothetical protein